MNDNDDPAPNRQPLILRFTVALTVLATVGVLMRVWARRLSGARFWWDDWTIVVALMGSYVTAIANLVGLHYGFGLHQADIRNKQPQKSLLILWLTQSGYLIAVAFTKYSVLFFYWRLFKIYSHSLRIWIISIAVLATLWYIAAQLVVIFQCTPVNFYWNRKIEGGQCINSNLFFVVITALLPPLDVTVLGLAVPVIWHLNISRMKQLGIIFILSLGLLDTIICIYRATIFHQIDPKDITWTDAIVGIWTNAEATVGVFCACLPTLLPLFHCCIGSREQPKSSYDRPPPFSTWNSRGEGFNSVVHSRTADMYPFGNDSTLLIKGHAQHLNNITVTTNITRSINPMESIERAQIERGTFRRTSSIISAG